MNRIKVKFEGLTLRLENVPKDSRTGVGVEIRVNESVFFFSKKKTVCKNVILEWRTWTRLAWMPRWIWMRAKNTRFEIQSLEYVESSI